MNKHDSSHGTNLTTKYSNHRFLYHEHSWTHESWYRNQVGFSSKSFTIHRTIHGMSPRWPSFSGPSSRAFVAAHGGSAHGRSRSCRRCGRSRKVRSCRVCTTPPQLSRMPGIEQLDWICLNCISWIIIMNYNEIYIYLFICSFSYWLVFKWSYKPLINGSPRVGAFLPGLLTSYDSWDDPPSRRFTHWDLEWRLE